MSGVAYTAGSSRHKEIHLSTDYIDGVDKERLKDEIEGVVRHEMVCALPFTARWWLTMRLCGRFTCGSTMATARRPGGSLRALRIGSGSRTASSHRTGLEAEIAGMTGLSPYAGNSGFVADGSRYQNTAYFLDWLEDTYGEGTVVGINKRLKDHDYCDDMWVRLSGGKSVHELWEMYCHCYGLQPIAGGRPMDEASSSAMDVKPIPVYNAAAPPSRTEILIDQETEPVAPGSPPPLSLPGTADSESSYSPFPFRGESALAEIFTGRLKKLTFDGERDGRRFVKVEDVCGLIDAAWLTPGPQEFEALVGRVNSEMGDDDKRLLLVCSTISYLLSTD